MYHDPMNTTPSYRYEAGLVHAMALPTASKVPSDTSILADLAGPHRLAVPLAPEVALREWRAGSDPTHSPNSHCSAAWVGGHQKSAPPALSSQGYQGEIQRVLNCFVAFSCCKISAHPNAVQNHSL